MTKPASKGILDPQILRGALLDSFKKLDPRALWRNPVMFAVEVGSVITSVNLIYGLVSGKGDPPWFTGVVTVWLWLTVLFATFAEAVAEGRGKARAEDLRKTRTEVIAKKLKKPELDAPYDLTSGQQLRKGDIILVEANDLIPGDGEVIVGAALVDESAITGESAPVVREAGGDRSAVTGGTRVIANSIVVRITANPGETFLDRMIALVEGAKRRKTPNEIALEVLLIALTLVFLLVVIQSQFPFHIQRQGHGERGAGNPHRAHRPLCLPGPHHHRGAAPGHRHRRHGPAVSKKCHSHVRPGH